jgi:hypothetical protein
MRDTNGLVTILEGTIREIVRQEVTTAFDAHRSGALPGKRSRWMTPPAASRELGISEKAIRRMIKAGIVATRLRDVEPNPRQPKYLVSVDDVAAAAERQVSSRAPGSGTVEKGLAERALQIRTGGGGR